MASYPPPPGPHVTALDVNRNIVPIFREGQRSMMPGTIFGNGLDRLTHNFKSLLGHDVKVISDANDGEYDVYSSMPFSSGGINVKVNGRCRQIQSDVLLWMARQPDPIRFILDTKFTNSLKTTINSREVIPSMAIIVPERALAPTPTIKYKSHTVPMVRIGFDAFVNTEMFLDMASAIDEMELKVMAIKQAMQAAVLHIAYRAVMKQGRSLIDTLMKSSRVNMHLSEADRIRRADHVYATTQAGAIHHPNGLINLMDSLRQSAVYTPNTAGKPQRPPVIILPVHIGLTKHMQPVNMTYSITGLPTDKILADAAPLGVDSVGFSSAELGGAQVLTYTPPPAGATGITLPDELSEIMRVANFYVEKKGGVAPVTDIARFNDDCAPVVLTDFKRRGWFKLPYASSRNATIGVAPVPAAPTIDGSGNVTNTMPGVVCLKKVIPSIAGELGKDITNKWVWWLRPSMDINAQSGIVCWEPGAATGEILFAFPSVRAAEDAPVAMARLMARTFTGCCITNPQNLTILRGVRFAGILNGAGTNVNTSEKYNIRKHDLLLFVTDKAPDDAEIWDDPLFKAQCGEYSIHTNFLNYKKSANPATTRVPVSAPFIWYEGTTRKHDKNEIRTWNKGHFRKIDHPANVAILEGHQAFVDIGAVGDCHAG